MKTYIEICSQIQWMSALSLDEDILGSHGIPHGFVGKNQEKSIDHTLAQIHSTQVIAASDQTLGKDWDLPKADGLWTRNHSRSLGIYTADCLPILLSCAEGAVVMAVHAGWRGLAGGILENAVKILKTQARSPILAWIGPAICAQHFEIGPEVVEQFMGQSPLSTPLALSLGKGKHDRWHLDLGLLAALQLVNLGINSHHISVVRVCTFEHLDFCHSYRRDHSKTGRNISWIAMPTS